MDDYEAKSCAGTRASSAELQHALVILSHCQAGQALTEPHRRAQLFVGPCSEGVASGCLPWTPISGFTMPTTLHLILKSESGQDALQEVTIMTLMVVGNGKSDRSPSCTSLVFPDRHQQADQLPHRDSASDPKAITIIGMIDPPMAPLYKSGDK